MPEDSGHARVYPKSWRPACTSHALGALGKPPLGASMLPRRLLASRGDFSPLRAFGVTTALALDQKRPEPLLARGLEPRAPRSSARGSVPAVVRESRRPMRAGSGPRGLDGSRPQPGSKTAPSAAVRTSSPRRQPRPGRAITQDTPSRGAPAAAIRRRGILRTLNHARGARHSPPATTTRRGHCNNTRDEPGPRLHRESAGRADRSPPGVENRPRRQDIRQAGLRGTGRRADHADRTASVAPTPSPLAAHIVTSAVRAGGNRPLQAPTPRRVKRPRTRPHRQCTRNLSLSNGRSTPPAALRSGRAGGFAGATAPRLTLARDLNTRLAPRRRYPDKETADHRQNAVLPTRRHYLTPTRQPRPSRRHAVALWGPSRPRIATTTISRTSTRIASSGWAKVMLGETGTQLPLWRQPSGRRRSNWGPGRDPLGGPVRTLTSSLQFQGRSPDAVTSQE